MSREREKERRASRERSLKMERKKYPQSSEIRNDDITLDRKSYNTRTSPIKRSQSGRILDRSTSREKPRALSFRVSPAADNPPMPTSEKGPNVKTTPKLAEKSARYSETHFSVSETTTAVYSQNRQSDVVDDINVSGVPPPLPARRYRQQRASEPVLYPSMQEAEDVQKRSLQEVSFIYFHITFGSVKMYNKIF